MRRLQTLPGVRAGSIPVLAIACGVTVGNIYLCQPLLAQIGQQFGVAENVASLVAVATQLGYAFGILLIVPLADVARPAPLVRWLMLLTSGFLAAAAFASGVQLLLVASVCFAVVTVVPQILIPLATAMVSSSMSVGSWPMVWAVASVCALIALPVLPRAARASKLTAARACDAA